MRTRNRTTYSPSLSRHQLTGRIRRYPLGGRLNVSRPPGMHELVRLLPDAQAKVYAGAKPVVFYNVADPVTYRGRGG